MVADPIYDITNTLAVTIQIQDHALYSSFREDLGVYVYGIEVADHNNDILIDIATVTVNFTPWPF